MSEYNSLLSKIETTDAVVGIVGMGYVGLPLAMAFVEAGFKVVGFDVDPRVVEGLRARRSHIGDVPSEAVAHAVESGLLSATADFARLTEADVVVICVPTPLSKTEDPDLSHVMQATESLTRVLRKGQLVVLESTTYPGTTRDLVTPALEASGLKAGVDFFVAFSPERVDPANPTWGIANTPKIVGGLTANCHRLAVALYADVIDRVVEVSSPEVAELAKILENTFRAVNIGLVNEMAVIADRLGIDVWEVIDAAATKPYGFMRFFPGPGLGGHCIPIDPLFLAWKMKTLQYRTRFIDLAAEVNAEMPLYVIRRAAEALNSVRKPVNGSRVLVLGVAYKPDVNDTRESPGLDLIALLRQRGAAVEYHDPHVPTLELESGDLVSVPLEAERLEATDLVLIATDHSDVDYGLVGRHASLVVDPRNAMKAAERAVVFPIAGPPRNGSRRSAGANPHSDG
jgi:UDP-N-acetyl-D-glucosamine dehydrogenase